MHSNRYNVYSFSSVAAAKAMIVVLARVFHVSRKAMCIETNVYAPSEHPLPGEKTKVSRHSMIMLVPENLPALLINADDLCDRMASFTQGYLAGMRGKRNDGIQVTTVHHKAHDYSSFTTHTEPTPIRAVV